MFFTLKLLRLGLKLVLLPFRLVAKLGRWLVGFAVGRAQGSASTGGSTSGDGSRDGRDAAEPARESTAPVSDDGPGEQSTGLGAGSTGSTTDGTRVGGQLLSARGYAGVMGVLVAGQVLGVLGYTLDAVSLPDVLDPIWVVAANPLHDLVYYPFLWPGRVGALYAAFAAGYGVLFGWLGVQTLKDGYVPARFVRPVARFFAANGVLYAVMPVLIVWQLPVGVGFVDGLSSFYADPVTLYQTVAYGSAMGALYVATFQLRPRPSDVSGSSPGTAGSGEQAPWAQTDGSQSAAAVDGDGAGDSVAEADSPTDPSADAKSTAQRAPDPAGAAGPGDGDAAADTAPDAGSASVTAESPAEATVADDGPADTGIASETTAATEATNGGDEAAEVPAEGSEQADTATEGAQPAETTNDAEAALGRLAADDADSRLAAAGDLQALAAEGHDYLTGERVGAAVEDEPDPEVRAALVDALGALDTDAATEALRDARFDPNPAVSDRAADHLD